MDEEKYVIRSIMGCKYERMPEIKWLGVEPSSLRGHAEPEMEAFRAEAEERKAEAMKGHTDPAEYARAACTVLLDNVIRDPARLRAETGVDPLPFFYMAACIKDGLKGDMAMPLVRGGVDEHRAGQQGSRCRLLPAHMAFLLLHAARSGNPQEMLESKFCIDQTAISRHIRLALGILTSPEKMPTAAAIAGEIADTPGDEVVEAIGHVINFDVTEFEIEAPRDKESNDDAFPGRAQATTARAIFACARAGLILAMGGIVPGRKHDITALREMMPFLGDIMRGMEDPDAPLDKRLEVNLDRGMQSADREWQGAGAWMPVKRAGGQKVLDPRDLACNRSVNSDRAIIENAFRRMKTYRLIGGIFCGSISDLEEMVVFVTGVVNLHRIMACIDPARSHRETPLAGMDVPGYRGRKPYPAFG